MARETERDLLVTVRAVLMLSRRTLRKEGPGPQVVQYRIRESEGDELLAQINAALEGERDD